MYHMFTLPSQWISHSSHACALLSSQLLQLLLYLCAVAVWAPPPFWEFGSIPLFACLLWRLTRFCCLLCLWPE